VNNGSLDRTQILAESFAANHPEAKVFFIEKRALGSAILKGITEAQYEYLFFYAIDIPFGFDVIGSSMEKIDSADIVIGSKGHPDSKVNIPPRRRIFSLLCNRLIQLMFDLKVADTQGSIMFKKSVIDKYLSRLTSSDAWLETQIIIYGNLLKARIEEIPITYSPTRPSKMRTKDAFYFLNNLAGEYPKYKKYSKEKNGSRK
jgi:glycosyltransferase involved in cell wall biosynthesis